MPNKRLWNNFAEVTYTFYVHYCAAEGLTETSDESANVMLYLFHGLWMDKGRAQPVIRCLHRKIISGRSRFGKYVQTHFALFIQAYARSCNKGWSKLFIDNGKGKATEEFLVLVEQGLRSFGTDIHAMGTGQNHCRGGMYCHNQRYSNQPYNVRKINLRHVCNRPYNINRTL